MLLGDMGADVVKIERPAHGDQTRAMPPKINGESASFAALNRNKRSLVLDLKQKQISRRSSLNWQKTATCSWRTTVPACSKA